MSKCKICQRDYPKELHSRVHLVQHPQACDIKAREMDSEPIKLCKNCHAGVHKRMGEGMNSEDAVKDMLNSLRTIFKLGPL